ncbi:hypothetical protein SUGI_0214160 [Cryptomeria japonica]|uniref:uncharacterized protein LOC131075794 n=1 Tax=Cryptomeria japonica TaxID=3369 RepID=UPI0024089F0A|nr:uncharacterized protein LOC131075794 [Cryptomeria japonica]XP_057868669.2 uncharacterized protein LOC131075794 [Cryptomeria japonica]GLJ13514.1 hypothetical protein SUGI_0214160 [Cryptomeria japonica]
MGKMHLNLYHTVWPSWVSSKRYKLKNNEESSSWMLARSLSLKRANERAKSYQRSGGDDEHGSQHRLSESIDALFVLSQLKEYGPDWFRYDDSCKGEKELWRDDDRKDSNGSITSVSSDNTSGLEMKGNYLVDNKDLKSDSEEKREHCRENDKKDFNGPWTEEPASMKSEGNNTNRGPEMDGHTHDLENEGVKFEDKKIVSAVEEETKISSMNDRKTRRVADSLSAFLPSEIFSRSVKESVALVKHSFNPYKDFRDSMMEMILASNIDISNSDLEEMLYCYFSLNPPEHHDLIKRAFMDIWLELQAV